ncbi:hypothetical protein GSU68_11260 [Rathayibacter sp. VKM Ac-2759]|uniref:hypothetical protein n=1 Tax=Rathayibacter sp. VKM Ac-2759 TaxID=2609252 RepID=UPI0013178564|nr:hypothetical protein [Rathayibacter sp. VKM Ac-2759]QHC67083.1 hypothetical protein GSU68_11260 [Rathayibacter sp. VKM Ac-2759]
MRILVAGGARSIGSSSVHLTLRELPDEQITVLDKLTYAGHRDSLSSVADRIPLIEDTITDAPLVADSDMVMPS